MVIDNHISIPVNELSIIDVIRDNACSIVIMILIITNNVVIDKKWILYLNKNGLFVDDCFIFIISNQYKAIRRDVFPERSGGKSVNNFPAHSGYINRLSIGSTSARILIKFANISIKRHTVAIDIINLCCFL